MLGPKCQLLQGKGKPGNHKALGILEKNLTKWGVEEEDNQFFAKIDHWVECLKHVFFFQMVASCIPSNLSHGIYVSQRIPRLQICSWGQFLGMKGCIISTLLHHPFAFHSPVCYHQFSEAFDLEFSKKTHPKILRLWGSDLSVTSQPRRLLTSDFVLLCPRNWSDFWCAWARPGHVWMFERGSNEFMRVKVQNYVEFCYWHHP